MRRLATLEFGIDMMWLVGGAFNEIASDSEKHGGRARPSRQMTCFNEALIYCNLSEVSQTEKSFTWFNNRHEEPIFARLDRFVCNEAWQRHFGSVEIRALDFYGSDHRPLWCKFSEEQERIRCKGRGRFHFEEKWFLHDHFIPDTLCEWKSMGQNFKLVRKLAECRGFMKQWAKTKFEVKARDLRALRRKRLELMEKIGDGDDGQNEELAAISKTIELEEEKEACHWKQRARVNWMANGDKNTRVFHAQASKRKRKNEIKRFRGMMGR